MTRAARRALVIAVLLGASGCGGGTDDDKGAPAPPATTTTTGAATSASDGAVDACSLLTPVEVGAAVGATVGAGKPDTSSFRGPECEWDIGSSFRQVHLTVGALGPLKASGFAEANRRSFERQVGAARFVVLAGIGESAFAVVEPDGGVTQVQAARGSRSLGISFSSKPVPSRDQATALLKTAVGRLPG